MLLVLIILVSAVPVFSQSPAGDVVGKLVVGYQGWFTAQGDGSPKNAWVHWARNISPRRNNVTFELYPDTREYSRLYRTDMANLGNGEPARLFSSWDPSTVDLHFKWMQQYNIDVAALQVSNSSLCTSRTDKYFLLIQKFRIVKKINFNSSDQEQHSKRILKI